MSLDRGIGSWVVKQAFLHGDQVALVDGTGIRPSQTYTDFDNRTNQLARALMELGVRRGDRVAMLLLNSITFMEATFACAKLGAIMVPVNVRLKDPEIAYILIDSGADVFLYHDSLAAEARVALGEEGVRVRHCILDQLVPTAPTNPPVPGISSNHALNTATHQSSDAAFENSEISYEDLLSAASSKPLGMDVDPRDIHAIMYTSGTTGRPKGAMLTHANAIANARNVVLIPPSISCADTTITVAPMFHIGGLGVHSLPFVYVGGKNVIFPTFDPQKFLQAMAEYKATVQFLVPAMWAAVSRLSDFDSYDLSSLRLALSGGAPTPLPVIEFFQSHGLPFQEGFGMTETAPTVAVLDAEHVVTKAGSIGRPLMHVEARIVDENDRDVPTGAVGELVLRGENIFVGYWMMPEATEEAFKGGWFHTGDLGRVDDEGFITLVDRLKDMIITGGENVYPVEVEQVLVRHPDVVEAAVFGIPDERWGETVVAAVVLEQGVKVSAEDIIEFCRGRMAHFKCPTQIVFMEELPRNATGKVLKTSLRRQYSGTEQAVTR